MFLTCGLSLSNLFFWNLDASVDVSVCAQITNLRIYLV
jgi:hypothetical protein